MKSVNNYFYLKINHIIYLTQQQVLNIQHLALFNILCWQYEKMDQILSFTDSSFKYFLLAFNLMSLVVVYMIKNKIKIAKQHHVLFVIAHPDDEAMFFRPTLRAITKDYFTHILCLSHQNVQRKEQFQASMKIFNIHKYECLGKQNLKDGQNWKHQDVRNEILTYVKQNNIKAIFTFDNYGISGHKNHIVICQSLKCLQLQKSIINKLHSKNSKEDESLSKMLNQSIKIYYLNSVNIMRKYSGVFQVLFGLLRDYSWINLNIVDAFRCMAIHKSQFVWYRKLWVIFSQYNYLNVYQLSRIRISEQKQENNASKTIEKTFTSASIPSSIACSRSRLLQKKNQ